MLVVDLCGVQSMPPHPAHRCRAGCYVHAATAAVGRGKLGASQDTARRDDLLLHCVKSERGASCGQHWSDAEREQNSRSRSQTELTKKSHSKSYIRFKPGCIVLPKQLHHDLHGLQYLPVIKQRRRSNAVFLCSSSTPECCSSRPLFRAWCVKRLFPAPLLHLERCWRAKDAAQALSVEQQQHQQTADDLGHATQR